MNVSDFVANISTGLARTNRFTVLFTPPQAALEGLGLTSLRTVLLLCDSASLPGININTAQTRTFGEIREIPYELMYEPINLTFYVDAGMYVKKMFDSWIMYTQIRDTRKFNYYDNYVAKELQILVQDMANNNRYVVTMYEAFPKTVSQVQMDYAGRDVMKVNVQMTYKYWRSDTILLTEKIKEPKALNFDKLLRSSQYNKNFVGFQEKLNINNVLPEGFNNYTGNPITYFS